MEKMPAIHPAKRARRVATAPAPLSLPAQGSGHVRVAGTEHFVLEAEGTSLRARRAASCLLQPEVGDGVAWCRGEGASVWVYAVLERAGTGPQQIALAGDTQLTVRDGTLDIRSDRALEFEAPKMELKSEDLKVRSAKAVLLFDALETIARNCTATLSQVHLVGQQISSVFERVFQHAQSQRRVVEGLDAVQAGNADWRAKSLMNLQGDTVLTNGERLVKSRGAQIHLG